MELKGCSAETLCPVRADASSRNKDSACEVRSKYIREEVKMGISWSADHHVAKGAELSAFMETWCGYLEQLEQMIADGV